MRTKVHPACDSFPMMSDEQYEGLKSDINERGQQEAIVYWNGQLVDGRNRLKACRELNIEPTECELDESVDPVAYVISANLHRRHLTTAQRSVVAAKLATLEKHKKKADTSKDVSQEDAAKLLCVSVPSVQRAKHIVANGSKELVQAVERGEVSLNQATKLVKATPDKLEQSKVVREGKDAIKLAISPPISKSKVESPVCDDEPDDYDYQVVKAFEHCDYRLNTLRRIVFMLEPHEKAVLSEFLMGVDA